MKYDGITRESLFLLADNRFRDSKAYYEEHKEAIKIGVTVPMRQIAGIIGEELSSVDPLMNTIPTKMVSRVRRDTRYTKDKSLYRENMWIMFMRPKHDWHGYPCFWFEVTPREYSMGIGFYGDEPGLLETFRKNLRERPEEFRKAADKCVKCGSVFFNRKYKRPFPGCPEGLEEYYNAKDVGFISFSGDLDDLKDERIIEIIRGYFQAYIPMYKFLLSVSDEYYSKEE
ncbi:MAG: DUF2461 domain-containing protein [Clostridia bacterium]|nr:DUF2461 domain-containing protein [Clostridia bacterium]